MEPTVVAILEHLLENAATRDEYNFFPLK